MTKITAINSSKYKYTAQGLQNMTNDLYESVESLKLELDNPSIGWLSLVGVKKTPIYSEADGRVIGMKPVKLIPTYRNTATPELDLDEAGEVNSAFLQKQWDTLNPVIQEQLLDYALHVEGFVNEGQNITHLIPKSVFEQYLEQMSKIKGNEAINEQFLDNMAREGVDFLEDIVSTTIEIDPENPNISSQDRQGQIKGRYFKTTTDEGTYVYRVTGEQAPIKGGGYTLNAEAIATPKDFIELGGKTTLQYKTSEEGKLSNPFEDESFDNSSSIVNEQQNHANDIAGRLDLDTEGDIPCLLYTSPSPRD